MLLLTILADAGKINNARPIPVLRGTIPRQLVNVKKPLKVLAVRRGRLSSALKEDGESTIVV